MKITTKILVACLPGIVTGALFAASTGERAVSKPNESSAMSKVKDSLGKLPLSFEPNRGQTDPRVQFLSRGPGYTVYFTKDETVLSLKDTKTSDAVVRMRFVGGTNSASPTPIDALPGKSNYLKGNDSSKWITGVDEYTKLRYENVYPGIDVLYHGEKSKNLRYDFIVKPGADASAIQMAYEGADKISINENGDLALTIDGKTLITSKPFTYQEDGGAKKEVASHFVMKDGRVSFELAKYDTTKDLVIDPGVIFVTFLGGLLNDSVNAVAIANPTLTIATSPSAYFVTGTTNSTNFPTTSGVVQTLKVGDSDVFVTKISFTGASILWSTYLGGNNQDAGSGIAVDTVSTQCAATTTAANGGCPVVVGQTFSLNFPTVPFQGTVISGATTPGLQGADDAFAVKLNQTGTAFIYSTYLGGIADDQATGVALDLAGDAFVGGYTDSPFFLCQGGIPQVGAINCTNSNYKFSTNSSDSFVVKIPVSFGTTSPFSAITANLYGGFGEEFAHAIAFNPTSQMVYLAGDTTTAAQNFVAPNNINLPGITNNTVNEYTVNGLATGLPGPAGNARGGFIVAFDSTSLVKTFATYVSAVGPTAYTGMCGPTGNKYPCNQGYESITGIAAEGGATAGTCNPGNTIANGIQPGTCSNLPGPSTTTISPSYGNFGHIYIGGYTTSVTPSAAIAYVAPAQAGFACGSPIIANSNPFGGPIIGPAGTPVVIPAGATIPGNCVPALYTQQDPAGTGQFASNQAVVYGCPFPLSSLTSPSINATCNLAGYVAILDGALLNAPVTAAPNPTGNQIEYWAYYSSANSSTMINGLAIDSNPTTLSSVYSLGTYQQIYVTGSSMITVAGSKNFLPTTNSAGTTQEAFISYNVGTTTGGGVGGYNPTGVTFNATDNNEIDAFVARFNPNGLAADTYGGVNQGACNNGVCNVANPKDRSPLIHTPQFNFGEFLYNQTSSATNETANGATPSTIGNAIAVDPTRAVLIGGATNVSNGSSTSTSSCTQTLGSCGFTTTNALPTVGLAPNGGTDGWVSVLFFNDILSNAGAQASANPWLQPGATQNTLGISYIETTPPPFGPTFDFAISDPSTQTQTFQVLFTGQAAGQLQGTTSWFVPIDARSGATQPTIDNGLPGSGIAYYIPCQNPSQGYTSLTPPPGSPVPPTSAGYYNNAYPAPGGAYGPLTCAFPVNDLYEAIPMIYSGWPGLPTNAAGVPNTPAPTPGWLLVSQEVSPGVVRLQLDRRAAAGLLEGTYVAQFLVTTYDSQHGFGAATVQWPPCGPVSVNNPFGATYSSGCNNASTPLPADNVSILVTVRLVVRPALFLSRNAGFFAGVGGPGTSLSSNPLTGPGPLSNGDIQFQPNATQVQDGIQKVPDWLFTGTANDTAANLFGAATNVNAGPGTCVPGLVSGLNWTGVIPPANLLPQTVPSVTPLVNVLVPCPISALVVPPPAVFTVFPPYLGAISGAAAYAGNGPGDLSNGGIGTAPQMTFLYDSGTVLTITPTPGFTECNTAGSEATLLANAPTNWCNLSPEQNLVPTRPDQPHAPGAPAFNAEWEGGVNPVTQRNDATVHDYYVTAEGAATLSVAAVNCTHWQTGDHIPAVGNWLAVLIGNSSSTYTPICTDNTPANLGTTPAVLWNGSVDVPSAYNTAAANYCATPIACTYTTSLDPVAGITNTGIVDDAGNPPTASGAFIGGQQITLDFMTLAFSNRPAMNGIPTGAYSAQVFVWSTRAKNVVPGYCLGASFPASPLGIDPFPPCTPSVVGPASTANPNPEVVVSNQQMFTVSLLVFDTTQVIQLTPNTCPTAISGEFSEFATVANPENLFTGNIIPPFGPGSLPNYPNFGQNGGTSGQQLVEWSLLPFQTTGTSITGCISSTNCAAGNPLTGGTGGNLNGGNVSVLTAIPLPQGVTVNPQTLAQYNACALPTGTFNGTPITGASIPGIGQLVQTGPVSQTTVSTVLNGTNSMVTLYACRPTIAPAWLNSPLYPGNNVSFPSSPEPYANGNGPYGGSNGGATVVQVTGCIALGSAPCPGGHGPVPSIATITCPLSGSGIVPPVVAPSRLGIFRPGVTAGGTSAGGSAFLLDQTGANAYIPGQARFIQNFFTPGGFNGVTAQVGDMGVAGDWTGDGHYKVGIYRASTGTWYLDANNDGVYDAGDYTYTFGGLTAGGNVDTPIVGDWTNIGKSCIGINRFNQTTTPIGAMVWLLDLNCNGTFDNTPTDAFFPFGGIKGDVPVVGAWTGLGTPGVGFKAGVVREYAPAGVPIGSPFFWVLDAGAANAGTAATAHPACTSSTQAGCTANTTPFAYGGLAGDIFVTGDWEGTNIWHAGIYRQGNWIEDTTGAHTYDTFYQFGGLATDTPVVGKW